MLKKNQAISVALSNRMLEIVQKKVQVEVDGLGQFDVELTNLFNKNLMTEVPLFPSLMNS